MADHQNMAINCQFVNPLSLLFLATILRIGYLLIQTVERCSVVFSDRDMIHQ